LNCPATEGTFKRKILYIRKLVMDGNELITKHEFNNSLDSMNIAYSVHELKMYMRFLINKYVVDHKEQIVNMEIDKNF